MKFIDGAIVLSTGREVDAAFDIIGLNLTPDGTSPLISSGYDGVISSELDPDPWGDGDLTAAEVAELAQFMIDAWADLKRQAEAKCTVNAPEKTA